VDFKIKADDVYAKSIAEVRSIMASHYKCPLKELTYLKMLVDAKGTEAIRHGVYLIFDDIGNCAYVGKCEASHLVDRLGFHFGMSPNYKYTFLSKLVEHLGYSKDFDGYVQAVNSIGDYSYMIVNANFKGEHYIRKLEKMFMVLFQPYLNKLPKKVRNKKGVSASELFAGSLY
jgi:hypothetical protein